MFSMQYNTDVGGLSVKVLQLCLLLKHMVDISASLKTLENISAIIRKEKNDTYTFLGFSSRTSL